MTEETLIHGVAVAVAVDPDGPLAGALLIAPSGCGKSALALALIETCPWRRSALVADDAVILSTEAGAIVARAPEPIAGLIEIRGFGPVRVRAVERARIVAGFDLAAPASRLPETEARAFSDQITLALWPFQPGASGAIRLRAALRSILGGQTP
jgi:HPr kinase/phosphorylase